MCGKGKQKKKASARKTTLKPQLVYFVAVVSIYLLIIFHSQLLVHSEIISHPLFFAGIVVEDIKKSFS